METEGLKSIQSSRIYCFMDKPRWRHGIWVFLYIQQRANGEDISVSGDFINVTNNNKMLWMVIMTVIKTACKWAYNDKEEHLSKRRIAEKPIGHSFSFLILYYGNHTRKEMNQSALIGCVYFGILCTFLSQTFLLRDL